MHKGHRYKKGDFALLMPRGEVVKIIGSSTKRGLFKDVTYIRVGSLKNLDPNTEKFTQYYDCEPRTLCPILDDDVQFLLKMAYSDKIFNIARQI